MHFEIEKDALLPLLRKAQSCTSTKGSEATRMVRLTVAGQTLQLASTDFVLQYQATSPCVGKEDGVVFVEAKGLRERVEGLVSEKGKPCTVSFKTNASNKATLKHLQSKRTHVVSTAEGKGYAPVVWGDAPPPLFTIAGSAFATLVGAASWCTDPAEVDPVRNAVHVMVDEISVRIEATNMSSKGASAKMPHAGEHVADVPLALATAHAFASLAASVGEGLVTFHGSARTASLATATERIGAAVLSAVAPSSVGQLFAFLKGDPVELVIDKVALESAALAARLASVGSTGFAAVHLVAMPGALHVIGDGEGGKSHDVVALATPVETPFTIPFSFELLLGAIKATVGPDLCLLYRRPVNTTPQPTVFEEKLAWYETTVFLMALNLPPTRDVEAVLGGVEP